MKKFITSVKITEYKFSLGPALTFALIFVFINGASSSSDWYSRRVHIYDCNSNNNLTVKYVRNNSRVIFDQIAQSSLWIQYHET